MSNNANIQSEVKANVIEFARLTEDDKKRAKTRQKSGLYIQIADDVIEQLKLHGNVKISADMYNLDSFSRGMIDNVRKRVQMTYSDAKKYILQTIAKDDIASLEVVEFAFEV